jgi:peroxiredoxin Q/BCP
MKELKALFGNMYPDNRNYLKFRNFYRFYLTIYLLLFTSYLTFSQNNNMNKIKIGSNIPTFTLPDQNGNLFDIKSVLGKKNLVIYFYPKDDSPGCTKEACSFRDQFEVFKEADAVIIGISGQSVESHKEFAEKHRLSFTLLSDEGDKIRKQFGVPTNLLGLLPGRVTYIADKTGKVIYLFDSQMQATRHVDEALRILKELK